MKCSRSWVLVSLLVAVAVCASPVALAGEVGGYYQEMVPAVGDPGVRLEFDGVLAGINVVPDGSVLVCRRHDAAGRGRGGLSFSIIDPQAMDVLAEFEADGARSYRVLGVSEDGLVSIGCYNEGYAVTFVFDSDWNNVYAVRGAELMVVNSDVIGIADYFPSANTSQYFESQGLEYRPMLRGGLFAECSWPPEDAGPMRMCALTLDQAVYLNTSVARTESGPTRSFFAVDRDCNVEWEISREALDCVATGTIGHRRSSVLTSFDGVELVGLDDGNSVLISNRPTSSPVVLYRNAVVYFGRLGEGSSPTVNLYNPATGMTSAVAPCMGGEAPDYAYSENGVLILEYVRRGEVKTVICADDLGSAIVADGWWRPADSNSGTMSMIGGKVGAMGVGRIEVVRNREER